MNQPPSTGKPLLAAQSKRTRLKEASTNRITRKICGMLHTPLHRLLGEAPGALTDAMIDAAVEQGIAESGELDWKTQLPSSPREFKQSDHVKDIAAFANAGGGMLVFGVKEKEKLAVERTDAGDFDENYERTIQAVCMTVITPPIFGVRAYPMGAEPTRAVALVVPPSVDGPHLIYKGDHFAAPLRVDADTHWMKERELETAYRARFDAARRAQGELQNLYDEMAQSFDTSQSAVFVGSARPRVSSALSKRRAMADAAVIMDSAKKLAGWWLAMPSGDRGARRAVRRCGSLGRSSSVTHSRCMRHCA